MVALEYEFEISGNFKVFDGEQPLGTELGQVLHTVGYYEGNVFYALVRAASINGLHAND